MTIAHKNSNLSSGTTLPTYKPMNARFFEITLPSCEFDRFEVIQYDKSIVTVPFVKLISGYFHPTLECSCTVYFSGPNIPDELIHKIDSRTGGVNSEITHPRQIGEITDRLKKYCHAYNITDFEIIVPFRKGADVFYIIIGIKNGRVSSQHAVPPTERRDFKFRQEGKFFVLPY